MSKNFGKSTLGDEQSRDLEALFDEELSGARAEALKSKIASADPAVRAEWELLGLLREGTESWYKERCTDDEGIPCTCDIWDRLAPQLRRLPVPCEASQPKPSWLENLKGILPSFALRPVPAAAFAVVLLVGVAAIMQNPNNADVSGQNQIARTDAQETANPDQMLASNSPAKAKAPMTGRIEFGQKRAASHQAALVGFRPGERSRGRTDVYSSSPMDSDREAVRNGENPIDIDWIRSKRSIQFVRPRDRNTPPVIWLASN